MIEFKIAWRNLARSKRRTFTTMFAIASSAIGMMLFGGFVQSILLGFETNLIQFVGHISIFEKGYSDYGLGKVGEFSIKDWEKLKNQLKNDKYLKNKIKEAQPWIDLGGIAGNAEKDASKPFFGGGAIPEEREKFKAWNDYGLKGDNYEHKDNDDEWKMDEDSGAIGVGLAEYLKLCGYGLKPCVETRGRWKKTEKGDERPEIQLLSGAAGAPNIVRFRVGRFSGMGGKDFDDNYILMHLKIAQRLIYGPDSKEVTALKIQLTKSGYLNEVTQYLNKKFFQSHNLKLEVRNFKQQWPLFGQVQVMFGSMFTIISVIMAVVALFSINNTMTMCVLERIGEIGTLRSMGLRQINLTKLFLAEGMLVGLLGGTFGIILGAIITVIFNSLNVTWLPPNQTERVPLTLLVFNAKWFVPACWALLAGAGTLSAVFPAIKAGKMNIVDALRAS